MELKMFSIYDKAVQVFNTPFAMKTESEAIRAFKHMAQDEQTTIYKSPEDFILYECAFFDTADGQFGADAEPRKVCVGTDFPVVSTAQEVLNLVSGGDLKAGGTA